MTKKHTDEHDCREGTAQVPRDFKPCCDVFEGHTRTCVYDIRYEWYPAMNQWGIAILETFGGGYIEMNYCPHCGTKLGG